jgi:hypothetical protein
MPPRPTSTSSLTTFPDAGGEHSHNLRSVPIHDRHRKVRPGMLGDVLPNGSPNDSQKPRKMRVIRSAACHALIGPAAPEGGYEESQRSQAGPVPGPVTRRVLPAGRTAARARGGQVRASPICCAACGPFITSRSSRSMSKRCRLTTVLLVQP